MTLSLIDIPINQQELGMFVSMEDGTSKGCERWKMEDGRVGFQSQHVTSTGTFAGTRHLTESINGCVCLMLLTRCFFFGGMAVICSDTESETWWCKRTGKERFWCIKGSMLDQQILAFSWSWRLTTHRLIQFKLCVLPLNPRSFQSAKSILSMRLDRWYESLQLICLQDWHTLTPLSIMLLHAKAAS